MRSSTSALRGPPRDGSSSDVRRKREERIRSRHPKLGGLILALSDEPQSTKAWDVGAVGEERVGTRLNELETESLRVLHDRRIPGSRANIDHIAVAASGVYVIDPKRYKGRPSLKVEGGLLRPRVEKLLVGGRDCTGLVDGVLKQVDVIRGIVGDEVPVHGVLCFVDADWPLIGGSFTTPPGGGTLAEEAVSDVAGRRTSDGRRDRRPAPKAGSRASRSLIRLFGGGRCPCFECRGHGLELGQCRGEVLDDLAGDDLGGGQVVEVLQRLVAQPGDVEVDLVPSDQLVVGERLRTARTRPARRGPCRAGSDSTNSSRWWRRSGFCLRVKCWLVRRS